MGSKFLAFVFVTIYLLPLTVAAQPAVRFRDIPLGEPLKATTTQFKQKGFKVVKTQAKGDSLFYGRHQEVFLLGELEGYPSSYTSRRAPRPKPYSGWM